MMPFQQLATCTIAAAAAAGIVLRPFRLPEAVWAVAGALLVVGLGLLPLGEAWSGLLRGGDVYLFLTGMMLLAEVARREGLFEWLAVIAIRHARGSPARLFVLVYGVGVLVTVFLSNDATAIVLAPAVAAVTRAAKAANPLPYLLICAFVANAASFVLPISNPANLVIYGSHMPPLLAWLPHYALPSLASILVTFVALRWSQRKALIGRLAAEVPTPALRRGGKLAAYGLGAAALALLTASACNQELGLPTALAGVATATIVLISEGKQPWPMLRRMSWSILPLVAGLFVLVAALDRAGIVASLSIDLGGAAQHSAVGAAAAFGAALAVASNLINNLPAALMAGRAIAAAHVPEEVVRAALIGVDLGPNLSVTGSLATILWLIALRAEGQGVSAGAFFRLGLLIMPAALIFALAAALMF